MIDISEKIFALIVIVIVALMQIYAWYCGHDGAVFAFSSFIIGAVTGKMLNFTYKYKEVLKNDTNKK